MSGEYKQDVYMEVASRFRNYIEKGVYKSDEALPSVRAAAADFGVNPNTVQKAYALLESEGYIVVRPKKGAYVARREASGAPGVSGATGTREEPEKELLRRMKADGIGKETLINWIKEIYDND